jgi:hypothetical protein
METTIDTTTVTQIVPASGVTVPFAAPYFDVHIFDISTEARNELSEYLSNPDQFSWDWPVEVIDIRLPFASEVKRRLPFASEVKRRLPFASEVKRRNRWAKEKNMRRGDVLTLLELYEEMEFLSDGGRNDANVMMFWDGEKLIHPGRDNFYPSIPSEFQVCTEFPIHHWAELQDWDKSVYFNFAHHLGHPNPENVTEISMRDLELIVIEMENLDEEPYLTKSPPINSTPPSVMMRRSIPI